MAFWVKGEYYTFAAEKPGEEEAAPQVDSYKEVLLPILKEIEEGADTGFDAAALDGLPGLTRHESVFVDESEKVVVLKEHVEEPVLSEHDSEAEEGEVEKEEEPVQDEVEEHKEQSAAVQEASDEERKSHWSGKSDDSDKSKKKKKKDKKKKQESEDEDDDKSKTDRSMNESVLTSFPPKHNVSQITPLPEEKVKPDDKKRKSAKEDEEETVKEEEPQLLIEVEENVAKTETKCCTTFWGKANFKAKY